MLWLVTNIMFNIRLDYITLTKYMLLFFVLILGICLMSISDVFLGSDYVLNYGVLGFADGSFLDSVSQKLSSPNFFSFLICKQGKQFF